MIKVGHPVKVFFPPWTRLASRRTGSIVPARWLAEIKITSERRWFSRRRASDFLRRPINRFSIWYISNSAGFACMNLAWGLAIHNALSYIYMFFVSTHSLLVFPRMIISFLKGKSSSCVFQTLVLKKRPPQTSAATSGCLWANNGENFHIDIANRCVNREIFWHVVDTYIYWEEIKE